MGIELIHEWLTWGQRHRQWSGTTPALYGRRLLAADAWMRGQGWAGVTRGTEAQWADWWGSLPATPASRNLGRKVLWAYGEFLSTTGRRASNPAAHIPTWHQRPGLPRPLPPAEARRLLTLAASRNDFTSVTVMVLGWTALRVSEAARMRWSDITGDWLHLIGKGSVPGDVPIAPALARSLQRWRPVCGSATWVFPGQDGPAVPDTLRRHCKTFCGCTPHRWRHHAATALMEETGDLRLVQEFLRHSSPAVTSIYTQVNPQRLAAAVTRMYDDEAA